MECSNCDGKNPDKSVELICQECKKPLFKVANSSWFYCLNNDCNINAIQFNNICPKYDVRCMGCCVITRKQCTEDSKEEENAKPHFVCEINYASNQDWRTDFAFGQKGSNSHGHMAASGAAIWYLRDEQGNEIIVDGKIVSKNTSQLSLDCKQEPSEEPQHPEKFLSENEDN